MTADYHYERLRPVMNQLRTLAASAVDADDPSLGEYVGHLTTEHADDVPRLLLLAMIDVALLRVILRDMAADIAKAEGTTLEQVIDRYYPDPEVTR